MATACVLAVSVTAAKALVLLLLDPFTLIEDEAHYWLWSRSLDWSYYSKPPGIAWAIALSTALLGTSELAIRTPALIASAIGAIAAAGLARDAVGGRGAPLIAAAIYLSMPIVQATSILSTIDGPMLACWAVAAWAGWRALRGSSPLAWMTLGLALAAGLLFKPTAALFIPGFIAFTIARRASVARSHPRWPLLAGALALVGCVPLIIWNAGHGWLTFRHLLGHASLPGGDTSGDGAPINPLRTFELLGFAVALAGAAAVLALQSIRNMRRAAPGTGSRVGGAPAYLLWIAAAPLGFYVIVSLLARTEANWPAAATVTLPPLGAWAVLEGRARGDAGVRAAWHAALVLLAGGLLALPLLGIAAQQDIRPLGIPVHRAAGADELAAQAHERGIALMRQTGLEPFYMTEHYGRASLLSYYLPGRPTVYAASGVRGGGRGSQFDIWPRTDLSRSDVNDRLRGRPAVLFGGLNSDWSEVFERVEEIGPLPAEPKRTRSTWIGTGFLGFDTRDDDAVSSPG